MKSPYVGELSPNEIVTAHFLVLTKEVRQKKTGEPYLSLQLADKTGEIEAKMWDNVAEVMDTFDRDDFVKVKGLMQLYQKRSQFTVHKLRRVEDREVDFADFFPCADRDVSEMVADLENTIRSIQNSDLRQLLETIFADQTLSERYRMAPAAKSIHHACRGGLLQHVLSLCSLARATAPLYPYVDLDLLLTGVILHDIGKTEELTYTRSFNYSPDGQLLGHIIIGLRIIGEAMAKLPSFPPRLRTLVEHMVLSHHGELEYGSPKLPGFPEALLLHHLDNLDSKMETMRQAIARDAVADNEFTGWIPSLERVALRKERFLRADTSTERPAPPPVDEPAPLPAPPVPAAPPPVKPAARPAAPTLFGEKLQAVLISDK